MGREDELALLDEALAAAERGRPSLTLVTGDAGVGKTRLLRELGRRADNRGFLALRGECVPLGESELPFAPIVAVLRMALRGPAAELLEEAPEPVRVELARLAPELARPGDEPPAPSATSRSRLFEQLLAVVRLLTTARLTLIVLEDLHWSDAATRDLLAFLVRSLHDERIATVVSYRREDVDRSHPLRATLTELARRDGVRRLELAPLGRRDVERQLEDILGRPAPLAMLDTIHRRAEGNPFFVEELLAAEDRGGALPVTIADALLARVDTLSASALRIVQLLAVAGRPLPGGRLAAAGISEGEAQAAIREALAANVVTVADGYDLRHALLREAVYAELLPGERRVLHDAVGRALEGAGADASELAYHWHAAGDVPRALAASIDAGRSAKRVFAFTQALDHFERALELWDEPGLGMLDRIDVLMEAAEAARLTGDYDRAAALCRNGLEAVDPRGQPDRAAALYERLGDSQFMDDEAALDSYRRALTLLPNAGAARSRLLGAEARTLTHLLRWDEARARADEALRLALEADTEAEEVRARMTLGITLAFLGALDEGERQLREAKRVSAIAGRPDDLARTELYLAEVLRLRGRFGDALTVMDAGAERSSRLGLDGSFGVFMRVNAAEDLFRLGRWDEADARLRECARRPVKLVAEVMHHAVAAQLAVARGDVDRATDHLDLARAACEGGIAAEFLPGVYAAAAELALWQQRPLEAGAEVRRGLALIGDQAEPLYTPALYLLGLRAEADVGPPSRESADALLADLQALAEPAPPITVAHVTAARAEHLRLVGGPASQAWAAAAAAWEGVEHLYPAAYARWRQAEAILSDGGSRHDAAEPLRRASVVSAALGATPLRNEIDALARAARIPLSVPEPIQTPGTIAGGLSPREHEVLELLAEGMTNRQIAERLFISERTVGVHVSRILGKLDARNRVMAARIGRQLGLVKS